MTFVLKSDPWQYRSPYQQTKYQQTLKLLPSIPIRQALELGCAEGYLTAALAARVGYLIAADISQIALKRASQHCAVQGVENVKFLRLDLVRDPLPSGCELIVCSEVLYYVSGQKNLQAVASKLADALAPGGYLLTAHALRVKQEPERTQFDWLLPFGANLISQTLSSTYPLQLLKEIRAPRYRLQLFQHRCGAAITLPHHLLQVIELSPSSLPALEQRVLFDFSLAFFYNKLQLLHQEFLQVPIQSSTRASSVSPALNGFSETMQRFITEPIDAIDSHCPVNSYNEWDPLEEVIVGRLEGIRIPSSHVTVTYTIPAKTARFYPFFAGRRYPGFLVKRAQKELDELIQILQAEGIVVRRPDMMDFSARYQTPDWSSKGFGTSCPRDGILIVGNEIIETPMPWRSRYFELHAYRSLFKEYFTKGARWTAAPKPQLLDNLYDYNFKPPAKDEPIRYVINEFEPVFDAADFIRCGRDIFVTKSNVTNSSGIAWLRRHLGEKYNIHEIESRCRTPMHIDSTFMPLAPGKVLVNPEYLDLRKLPKILKSWEILVAPQPEPISGYLLSMCSKWISLNVLMLDEKRVLVEKSQESMIKALKNWGFEPIPCPFLHYGLFGGSFHCATLDIRRKGGLQSYF